MDLIKIGKYIAEKRKELGMTQKQLAEKLGMSDKSVSKWERGVCLPDVSLYTSLCEALGISINEFLAGEDIQKENIVQRSDETIIEVVTESKYKQKRLKSLIYALLPLSVAALLAAGVCLFLQSRPQNFIAPVERNSIEMKTAEMLSDTNDAFIYKYKTTDDYTSLRLYVSEYQTGALIRKDPIWEIGYKDIGSPEKGTILIVPSMKNSALKVIAVDDTGNKISTEIPILENVSDGQYYGRSGTQIEEKSPIQYNAEQGLAALVYDKDAMRLGCIQEYEQGLAPEIDDYVYFFSFEFCK